MRCLLILFPFFLLSCGNKKEEPTIMDYPEPLTNTPECIIYLQPYGDFKESEARVLIPKLEEKFGTYLYGYWEFALLPSVSLPKKAYLKSINRYKATSILNNELKKVKKGSLIMGLTHEDICMDIHNRKNYGIIGCSFRNKDVCIVSDKRVKNKSDLWKPILHEFIHAFYGSNHCSEDNDSCIMQDGKGKGDFSKKEILCNSCKH